MRSWPVHESSTIALMYRNHTIIAMYQSGKGAKEIGKIFDLTESAILAILKKNGIQRRPQWGAKRKSKS